MSAQPCRRGGCTGVLDEGYCNVCGLAEGKRVAAEGLAPRNGTALGQERPTSGEGRASSQRTTGTGSSPVSRAARGAHRMRRSSRRNAHKQLGAGLVSLPDLPSVEPERAVLPDPKVPEWKRFCARCDAPVKRETGFCGKCGTRYNFVPSLRAGDLVCNQYEVKGPIAFGGLGWIYLAFDTLLSRYVVLKGLLNTQDSSAAAVAVAERQFLAAVKHPNIVAIYNFVQAAGEGFIVMEYVGGRTLKQVRQERGALPPAEAIAYIHRVLSAFAHLHRMGMVFCDFKPDNVMLEHDDVKLIDLGGVRRVGDTGGDIYGTVGYTAPEAGEGPTPASDLFTIGRTLAVLLTEIPGFAKEHRYTLPSPSEKPLFSERESLYRFLLKSTAERADDRFECAEEMAEQLLGVLREVVATDTGVSRPGSSLLFGADPLALEAGDAMSPVLPDPRLLPVPAPGLGDAGAQAVSSALLLNDPDKRVAALRLVCRQVPESREARLRLAAALADSGEFAEGEHLLAVLAGEDAWDWRVLWFQARMYLLQNRPAEAQRLFDQVYFDLPGELAPKLALGLAAEMAGEMELAIRMYDLVSRVDPSLVSAVFGLARCHERQGNRRAGVHALKRVAAASALYARAQVSAARLLLGAGNESPSTEDVLAAARLAENLTLDERDSYFLDSQILRAAIAEVCTRKNGVDSRTTVLGLPMAERPLRQRLEQSLRAMARFAPEKERIQLIDQANRVRPRTLI